MKTAQTFALTAIAAALFASNTNVAAGEPNSQDLTGRAIPAYANGKTAAIPYVAELDPDLEEAPAVPSTVLIRRGSDQAPAEAPVRAPADASASTSIEAKVHSEKVEPIIVALRRWLGRTNGVKIENGVVKFPYDMMRPVLVCAPQQSCDIELEPGEAVVSIDIVDNVRWRLSSGVTAQHIVVKPMIPQDEGVITTHVAITTGKRTYRVTLKSSPTDPIPRIGFYFPKDVVEVWKTIP